MNGYQADRAKGLGDAVMGKIKDAVDKARSDSAAVESFEIVVQAAASETDAANSCSGREPGAWLVCYVNGEVALP